MDWLKSIDVAVFRFVNGSLSNGVFDQLMPFVSGNAFFYPALLLLGIWLVWKGGLRGRICVLFLLVVIAFGDGIICKQLKLALARPRPFHVLEHVNVPPGIGKTGSGSMPSSHAANWFSATMVAFIFYRRSWRIMLPLACLVGFSRIYNGVHYPGDVIGGALLGAGYAVAIVWTLNTLWQHLTKHFFPSWYNRFPSLVPTAEWDCQRNEKSHVASTQSEPAYYLRTGYFIIGVMLLVRLLYLASGKIELSEDEAYQWLWSKHLALSYYSKPLMIALAQWVGTHIWGDTTFGVRFLSPIISAILSLITLRFLSREANARAGLIAVLVLNCAPLLAAGSILMTIDPPLILFWTAAMFVGWRAAQPNGRTGQWVLCGFFLGLSFLSKYAAFYQIVCWALFFLLWKPARIHLRKPGPYLGLLVFALCTLPILVWNAQHNWITVEHVSDNAGRAEPWSPTLKYLFDFLGTQALLLNPFFFVAMIWALFAFWRTEKRNPLFLFFFAMGAPVFLGYAAFSFYKRIFPNWIAPSVLPLFCLMILYWDARWRSGARFVKGWLIAGISVGLIVIVLVHDTNLIGKIAAGKKLPAAYDPLRRVRAWSDTARVVGEMRDNLARDGKPTFIIGAHYGLVGEISFYLPEARTGAQKRQPLAYYVTHDRFVEMMKTNSAAVQNFQKDAVNAEWLRRTLLGLGKPKNQIYFWPEYRYQNYRKGENAIFVEEVELKGAGISYTEKLLQYEFESIEDLGVRDIVYRDRVFRRLHFYACRGVK